MNLPMAPKSMSVTVSSGLPTAWIWSETSVPLQRAIEQTRRGVESGGWCEGFWCTACSVFNSLAIDCGVNISLVDPTVLDSNTEKILVKQGVGVTIDWPENPLQPFLTPWPVWPCWPC